MEGGVMNLKPGDSIVTAYAESAAGPGWANSPVWVIVRDGDGKLRQECLQPDEQSRDMALLYRMSAEIHGTMRRLAAERMGMKDGR